MNKEINELIFIFIIVNLIHWLILQCSVLNIFINSIFGLKIANI